MPVRTKATLWMDADIERVFEAVTTPSSIAAAFAGYGPIAGIERFEVPADAVFEAGMSRTIVNSDGTTILETMTRVEPPVGQSYELSNFSGPFRFLVSAAGGNWILREVDGGTHVTWEFRFDAFPLAWPVVKILSSMFHRAQMRSLRNTAAVTKR